MFIIALKHITPRTMLYRARLAIVIGPLAAAVIQLSIRHRFHLLTHRVDATIRDNETDFAKMFEMSRES